MTITQNSQTETITLCHELSSTTMSTSTTGTVHSAGGGSPDNTLYFVVGVVAVVVVIVAFLLRGARWRHGTRVLSKSDDSRGISHAFLMDYC